MSNSRYIQLLWKDHDYPQALSVMITLPQEWATLVVSLLTFLLTNVAASSVWNIASFLLHWNRSSLSDFDAVDLQHQVLLRNTKSPLSTLLDLFKVYKAWTKVKTPELRRRTWKIFFPALVVAIFFPVAAFVVPNLIATKNYGQTKVLLREDNCGFLNFDFSNAQGLSAAQRASRARAASAREYARGWYANDTTSGLKVSIFPQEALPFNTTTSSPCPIQPDLCVLGDRGAVSFDTGRLNSHSMFGINAPQGDRVDFRKVVTCTPMKMKDFVTFDNGTQFPNETVALISMGPRGEDYNFTFFYNEHKIRDGIGYQVNTIFSFAGDPAPGWVPAKSLNRTDADLTVIVIETNGVVYSQPVADPIFSANESIQESDGYFTSRAVLSAVACTDQVQICQPGSDSCTALTGVVKAMNTFQNIGLNAPQRVSASRLLHAQQNSITYHSVFWLDDGGRLPHNHVDLGAQLYSQILAALLARNSLIGLISGGLPDDQWIREARLWFQTSLAALQGDIVTFPRNRGGKDDHSFVTSGRDFKEDPEFNSAMAEQCGSQRIQSPAGQVQTFSVFGIVLVVALTAILFIVDNTIEWVLKMRLKGDKRAELQQARLADWDLELWRMAVATPEDGWQHSSSGVPYIEDRLREFRRPVLHGSVLSYVR